MWRMSLRRPAPGHVPKAARNRLLHPGWLLCLGACLLAEALHAGAPAWSLPGTNPRRGAALIESFGCGGCHAVPGIRSAQGNVGPPLDRMASRTYIAGMLRNTPANMVRWLRDPQGVVPGNAMPDMALTEAQALDIAAYLYTLH